MKKYKNIAPCVIFLEREHEQLAAADISTNYNLLKNMEDMYQARRQLILNILYITTSLTHLSDSHILKTIMLVETEK